MTNDRAAQEIGSVAQDRLPNARGLPQERSLALAARQNLTVIDGGPARCKAIDRAHYDVSERQFGRGAVRRRGSAATVMEADWLATPTGLIYVTPALDLWAA